MGAGWKPRAQASVLQGEASPSASLALPKSCARDSGRMETLGPGIAGHCRRRGTGDPAPRTAALEEAKMLLRGKSVLAWGQRVPRLSCTSRRRQPNPLTAKPRLEDPGGALERFERVHTPPCRPVAAGDKLAARSHLTEVSGPRERADGQCCPAALGSLGLVLWGASTFTLLNGVKFWLEPATRECRFKFNNYLIGGKEERREGVFKVLG